MNGAGVAGAVVTISQTLQSRLNISVTKRENGASNAQQNISPQS